MRNLRTRTGIFVVFLLALATCTSVTTAQEKAKSKDKKALAAAAAPTSVPDTSKSFQDALSNLKFREIGPATMGGRIDDIEVSPNDSRIIYAATAAGGILKSVNGGTSWSVIFDKEAVSSIGDIAISPSNPSIIWGPVSHW